MSFRLTLLLAATLSMSACATIDLNEVAAKSSPAASKSVNVNVVQRAASKLYAAFSSRGFVAKSSRKKMQTAARVLLNGLEDKDVATPQSAGYAVMATDIAVVLSDIRLASSHVEQTTKAAEVYLAMAPSEKSLRKELVSLEKALIASREASQVFEDALLQTSGTANALDYKAYVSSVGELRDVTNAFGDRVREAQMLKSRKANPIAAF